MHLTIEKNDMDCSEGAVYVYEGLPDFISVNSVWERRNLIGVFCDGHASFPVVTEAASGAITVFCDKVVSDQRGFLASYEVFSCPDNPGPNRVCSPTGKLTCNEGWKGTDCQVSVCKNRCSEMIGRGMCDVAYGRCLCSERYVGEDCSVALEDHMVSTMLVGFLNFYYYHNVDRPVDCQRFNKG